MAKKFRNRSSIVAVKPGLDERDRVAEKHEAGSPGGEQCLQQNGSAAWIDIGKGRSGGDHAPREGKKD